MSPVQGRHNIRRNASYARKSVYELKEIVERKSLSSACAAEHLKIKQGRGPQ